MPNTHYTLNPKHRLAISNHVNTSFYELRASLKLKILTFKFQKTNSVQTSINENNDFIN